jgi:hypothetical protein
MRKSLLLVHDAIQQEPSEQGKKILARSSGITGSKTAYQLMLEDIFRIEQARAIMKKITA